MGVRSATATAERARLFLMHWAAAAVPAAVLVVAVLLFLPVEASGWDFDDCGTAARPDYTRHVFGDSRTATASELTAGWQRSCALAVTDARTFALAMGGGVAALSIVVPVVLGGPPRER